MAKIHRLESVFSEVLKRPPGALPFRDYYMVTQCPACGKVQKLQQAKIEVEGHLTVYRCKNERQPILIVEYIPNPMAPREPVPESGYRLQRYIVRNPSDVFVRVKESGTGFVLNSLKNALAQYQGFQTAQRFDDAHPDLVMEFERQNKGFTGEVALPGESRESPKPLEEQARQYVQFSDTQLYRWMLVLLLFMPYLQHAVFTDRGARTSLSRPHHDLGKIAQDTQPAMRQAARDMAAALSRQENVSPRTRELLALAGAWKGDDAEKVLKTIKDTRSPAQF